MNILELQDNLKDVSDDVLMKEMQMPSGNAPQFLILSELKRRKRMRDDLQRREAANMQTVAEETITAAGMPQEGIMGAARAMAPESSIAQNTGIDTAMPMQPTQAPQQPQMAADGGIMKLQGGGLSSISSRVEDFMPKIGGPHDDDLNPLTGLGSNPAYTYETFLEENGLNDTPQAQEMFVRFKNFIDRREEVPSDPKLYSPFLDTAPDAPKNIDSGELPSISSMSDVDPRLGATEFGGMDLASDEFKDAANTLYPEGIGTATQEFLQKRNAGFGDKLDEVAPIPYLSSISKDADQRASAEAETDKPTFMGDVLPFLGDAAVAAGKSLYENTLKPEPLLEVGAVPNKREVLEGQIADINQQILDAEQANDEILANALTKRKNVLMRRIDTMEFSEDAGEVLRSVPGALQDVGSSIYQTFNEQVLAGVDPQLAAANIKASQDAVAARDSENEAGIESEAEREARIEALRGDATKVVPGISTEVSGFFPDLEMENPNIGDSTTPAPKVTTDDDPNKKLPVTDPDSEGFGSTDSRIAKMLSERQKQAESDKWMALAQAGFQIMGSKSPTLLGAIGEGGQAGLKALSASKKGMRDFETDMLKLETQLEAARLRSKGSAKMAPASLVTAAASRLRVARDTLDNAVSPVEKQNALDAYNAALEEYNKINAFVASQYGYTPSSSTGVGNNVPNLGDSANQSANQ